MKITTTRLIFISTVIIAIALVLSLVFKSFVWLSSGITMVIVGLTMAYFEARKKK